MKKLWSKSVIGLYSVGSKTGWGFVIYPMFIYTVMALLAFNIPSNPVFTGLMCLNSLMLHLFLLHYEYRKLQNQEFLDRLENELSSLETNSQLRIYSLMKEVLKRDIALYNVSPQLRERIKNDRISHELRNL